MTRLPRVSFVPSRSGADDWRVNPLPGALERSLRSHRVLAILLAAVAGLLLTLPVVFANVFGSGKALPCSSARGGSGSTTQALPAAIGCGVGTLLLAFASYQARSDGPDVSRSRPP